MNWKTTLALGLVTLALAAPLTAAHPTATVIDNPATGGRCYVYTNDTSSPELWRETNGDTSGGVGAGVANHFVDGNGASGLQRGGDNPDTQYDDAAAWAVDCLTA